MMNLSFNKARVRGIKPRTQPKGMLAPLNSPFQGARSKLRECLDSNMGHGAGDFDAGGKALTRRVSYTPPADLGLCSTS